jgi:hypothetical protein
MIVSVIIVFVVLLLAVVTTSKAYQFNHTIDSVSKDEAMETNKDSAKTES